MGRPAGSVLEFAIQGDVNGQTLMTVLHYVVNNPSALAAGGPEENAFLDEVDIAGPFDIVSPILAMQSVGYTVRQVSAQFVASTRFVKVKRVSIGGGTQVTPCTAQNVAAVLTRNTELAGRSQVSNTHIGGLGSGQYANGLVTGATLTLMGAVALVMKAQIIATLGGGTYAPVIYHRNQLAPNNQDPVVDIIPQQTLRTMRRRTIGLGI